MDTLHRHPTRMGEINYKKKDKSLVLKMLHSLTATTGSAAGESKLDPTSLCFPKEGHVA